MELYYLCGIIEIKSFEALKKMSLSPSPPRSPSRSPSRSPPRSPSPANQYFSSLKIARTRPRTNTDELLPQDFDHTSSNMPPRPEPEEVDEAYTQERLQSSLAYAVQFLKRRDISPRSKNFMEIFEEELKKTLVAANANEKKSGVTAVRVYEKLIEQNTFLWAQRFSQNLELETNL